MEVQRSYKSILSIRRRPEEEIVEFVQKKKHAGMRADLRYPVILSEVCI